MTTRIPAPPFGLPLTGPALSLGAYEAIRHKAPLEADGLSRASLIYESRDGLIRAFEDDDGHVSAINPARLVS